ncbi:MAG: RNA-binding domain-containing protein, partial [Lentisphaerota bacterium]
MASALTKDAVARAVCGMLNHKGGTVLVGVDKKGIIAGGGCTEQDANSLRHFLQSGITPQILFTTTLDSVTGGQVIVVDVPEGVDRPYVFDGTIYIQTGSETVKASAEAMRTMVENRAREMERWERRSASGLFISDLAETLLRETVQNAVQKRGYTFTDAKNTEAVLADLSLSRYGQLTNAADVLFGRRVALRQPQTRLRAVCYDTDKSGKFTDERLFEGPAFELLHSAMAFLKKHVAIGAEFPIQQLQRDSRPQYPFDALREGLVNALAHRDYASFGGSIVVSVYPGRIEIWN